MIWKQLKYTMRKPEVIAKMLMVSVLFLLGLREQLDLLDGFCANLNGAGQMNTGTFLIHAFNYFDFYLNLLLIGLVMLVPDFAQEEFLTAHITMRNKSRFRAGLSLLGKVMLYMFIYMMWFVMLAVLLSGILLQNFSAQWPEFLPRIYMGLDLSPNAPSMSLIMIPKSALSLPMPAVLLLVLLRSYLGFVVLAWIACFVILISGNSGHGIACLLFLLSFTAFIYYTNIGRISYYVQMATHHINLLPFTVFPFFTFRGLGVDFVSSIRSALTYEAVCLLLLGIGILLYYRKGDLGDANRNV